MLGSKLFDIPSYLYAKPEPHRLHKDVMSQSLKNLARPVLQIRGGNSGDLGITDYISP